MKNIEVNASYFKNDNLKMKEVIENFLDDNRDYVIINTCNDKLANMEVILTLKNCFMDDKRMISATVSLYREMSILFYGKRCFESEKTWILDYEGELKDFEFYKDTLIKTYSDLCAKL